MSLGIIVPHNVYQYKRHSIDRIIKQFSNTLQKAKEQLDVTDSGPMEKAKGNVIFLRQNFERLGRCSNLGAM